LTVVNGTNSSKMPSDDIDRVRKEKLALKVFEPAKDKKID
jgi:hypothetical protein